MFFWWWWAITIGIAFAWDYLSYKRNRLVLDNKSVRVETGVLTSNVRDIPFSKVQSVTVSQSVIGSMFGYGHIHITSGNELTPVTFKYIDNPQALRQSLQDKIS
jgi:uncharacterized membrane protein YdbT with pleckstrin-like domain